MTPPPQPDPGSHARTWIVLGVALLLAAGVVVWWIFAFVAAPAPAPAPTSTPVATSAPPVTPEPTPTPQGYPANTGSYALEDLPQVDVYAVVAALPVDDDPFGAFTGDLARAAADRIPVFADPAGEPVAALPREYTFDGTTVPVIERQEHWVHVLLTGRAAFPSSGNPAQVTGWLRAQDVEFSSTDSTIEVDLAARTIDIVAGTGERERVADDFGWGTEATPTPTGRAFVMMVRAEPSFAYTRGHPLVYLSVQSPTLDGFGGAPVAVTAFHYHDARSGAISNGCLRLGPDAIDRLAQLPVGTPVVIR